MYYITNDHYMCRIQFLSLSRISKNGVTSRWAWIRTPLDKWYTIEVREEKEDSFLNEKTPVLPEKKGCPDLLYNESELFDSLGGDTVEDLGDSWETLRFSVQWGWKVFCKSSFVVGKGSPVRRLSRKVTSTLSFRLEWGNSGTNPDRHVRGVVFCITLVSRIPSWVYISPTLLDCFKFM